MSVVIVHRDPEGEVRIFMVPKDLVTDDVRTLLTDRDVTYARKGKLDCNGDLLVNLFETWVEAGFDCTNSNISSETFICTDCISA